MADENNPPEENSGVSDRFARVTVPQGLDDPERRKDWGLPEDANEQGHYLLELNLQHEEGISGAANALQALFKALDLEERHRKVAKTYFACKMTVPEAHALAARDEDESPDQRALYRIWPDFRVRGLVDRSLATVKADAAFRAFGAEGENIVWAVLDSGVDALHPHFGGAKDLHDKIPGHRLLDPAVFKLHRCFCEVPGGGGAPSAREYLEDPDAGGDLVGDRRDKILHRHVEEALNDRLGHGTHVAGIISGRLPEGTPLKVLERHFKERPPGGGPQAPEYGVRKLSNPARLRGVAPECKIVSLRVLDDNGEGRTSDVLRALDYVREKVNDDPKLLRVHGVNLSLGYEFDAELFACGQSPICAEVDRLVQAGVVVVTAAGNTGYGAVSAQQRVTSVGLSNTINDPGNAALAITVGATHRDAPHTYGVSYFSSKGPTGDGRLKPDLVAPGERITSCATGKKLGKAVDPLDSSSGGTAYYVDESGTSMAAPHVSGAIAAFLSIRREFIGKPLEVKRILLGTATSLGRERYFEGHGLVDLMRAIQSI